MEETTLTPAIESLNCAIAILERLRRETLDTVGFGLVYDATIYLRMQRNAEIKRHFQGDAN